MTSEKRNGSNRKALTWLLSGTAFVVVIVIAG